MNVIKGVLEVENDELSSLPLTSAETANIPKALYEQTEKERWREYDEQKYLRRIDANVCCNLRYGFFVTPFNVRP